MRIDRDPGAAGPIVRGFGARGFRLDDDLWYRALLLSHDQAHDWTPPALADLTADDLAPVLAPRPEFVLIGTGATLMRPPASLVAALEARDIGLEPMDSRAAARAWGVLRGEGRTIAAALYPI